MKICTKRLLQYVSEKKSEKLYSFEIISILNKWLLHKYHDSSDHHKDGKEIMDF